MRYECFRIAVNALRFIPLMGCAVSAGASSTSPGDHHAGRSGTVLLEQHDGPVLSLAFSPDGGRVYSAGRDATVRVWDITDRNEVLKLSGGLKSFAGAAFSPVADTAISVGQAVEIFDLKNERVERFAESERETGTYISAAYSPSGRFAVTGDGQPHRPAFRVWEVQSGAKVKELRVSLVARTWAIAGAFSPDGRVLAGTSGAPAPGTMHLIYVWNWEAGRLVARMTGHRDGVRSVAFSPNGEHLLSGSLDQTVRVWDWQNGQEMRMLKAANRGVAQVGFSTEGDHVLCASGPVFQVWNFETGEEVTRLEPKEAAISAFALSRDGTRIAFGYEDGTILLSPFPSNGMGDE